MSSARILIAGGGAAGISTAASLLKRNRALEISVIEPAETHMYQPGWTMVGGGVFSKETTARPMQSVMPAGVNWIKASVIEFRPDSNSVLLSDGREMGYDWLIVATGLQSNWDGIPGLSSALGKNGVTSNYRYDLAPYTWELVRKTKSGRAIFTQPPMPIKCPGAPQKAMYLSCSKWRKDKVLDRIDVQFHTAGPALFGVAAYVPGLMNYVQKYNAKLNFGSKLVAVDGPNQTATFAKAGADGAVTETQVKFDMLHVTPPQKALDVVAKSPLADAAGFVEVDAATLRHVRFGNVFGLGDCCSTANSKTAAAARKQAPIVAEHLLACIEGRALAYAYDGYGSCPLTVEHGKVILAEFGYGGKLLPSFPLDSTVPRGINWWLKASFLPWMYWNAMLKGREWLATPRHKNG